MSRCHGITMSLSMDAINRARELRNTHCATALDTDSRVACRMPDRSAVDDDRGLVEESRSRTRLQSRALHARRKLPMNR